MGKTYRIKDIAEMSGVSTGTVDPILHNRGKVSEEAQKKVEKVLKEIGYEGTNAFRCEGSNCNV